MGIWNDYDYDYDPSDLDRDEPRPPRCKFCGSTDVRWRMQTGKWTLFDSKPGVLHTCPIKDDFDVVPE